MEREPWEDESETRKRRIAPPPEGAMCAQCGSDSVSSLPFFSTGSGVAYRPDADDVICRRCSHIGQPVFSDLA